MKVYIDNDEEYPVFYFSTDASTFARSAEVDDETYARWERITADYHAVQAELANLYDGRPPASTTDA